MEYQKNVTKNAKQRLHGVKGIVNNISIKQAQTPSVVEQRIAKTFERSAKG